MTINTITDLIESLRKIRDQKGDMFVRTVTQSQVIIDTTLKIDTFYNENKSVSINVLLIKGHI